MSSYLWKKGLVGKTEIEQDQKNRKEEPRNSTAQKEMF